MSLAGLLTMPCTITTITITAGTADVYGDPTATETTVDTLCYIEQRRTNETTGNATVASEEWLGVFLPDEVLSSTSKVGAMGATFELDGPPWPVWNPRQSRVDHIEANLRRTT